MDHLHNRNLTDHYRLEQPTPGPIAPPRELLRPGDPREEIWMDSEDYQHSPVSSKYPDPSEYTDSYECFAKSAVRKLNYKHPCMDSSGFGLGKDPKGGRGSIIKAQPFRGEDQERSRCVYRRDLFNHEENRWGHWLEAPNSVGTCIHRVSCM